MITLITAVCAVCGLISWLTFALLAPALYLLETGFLWVLYLAVMSLQRARDEGRLHPDVVAFARAALYVGLAEDLLYNWSWAIVVFRDIPREPLVTGRLERYKYGADQKGFVFEHDDLGQLRIRYSVVGHIAPSTGWRYARADWYAAVMLDPFAPSGLHVKP